MSWLVPARITEPVVLRVLGLGFALVLALLGAGGVVALRGTQAIQDDVAQVGREQLAMARLLNDVQAGQNTMAAILHQLAQGREFVVGEALVHDLEAADRAVANFATSAIGSPEAAAWDALSRAARDFSLGVRSAIARGNALQADELGGLLTLHDRVVFIERQLLEASERRMEAAEDRIEMESRDLVSNARWLLGTCLVLAALCAVITVAFAHSAIRTIEAQASELGRVSWHLLQSQESAARRFSHELHDELGQSLVAIQASVQGGTSVDWQHRRADCLQLIERSIDNVRELSQLLHPVILDDFGLDAGLRWLAEGFAQRTGIRTEYQSNFRGRSTAELETHLFRIAQEGLTNVARHAGATHVRLELQHTDGHLRMTLEDDGRGLVASRPSEPRPSLGMIGMRARANEIGGHIRLASPPGGGLRFEVEVPLPRAEEALA